jgi:hypothetical protein
MTTVLLRVTPRHVMNPDQGITLEKQHAEPGHYGDPGPGQYRVVKITDCPEGTNPVTVQRLYASTAEVCWLYAPERQSRTTFRHDELGAGRMIRE